MGEQDRARDTAELVKEIMERRRHPEQGYRSCLGIMRLGQSFGAERLEAAARRALHLGSYSYGTVKNILAAGAYRLPLEEEIRTSPMGRHETLRGSDYYVEREASC